MTPVLSGSGPPKARVQRGSVTAETAIVLPILVLALVAGIWVIGAMVAGVRCGDAARDAARAIARGESEAAAAAIGRRVAPPGARIVFRRDGEDVVVEVSAEVRADQALLKVLPSVDVGGRAVVQLEPGGTEDSP